MIRLLRENYYKCLTSSSDRVDYCDGMLHPADSMESDMTVTDDAPTARTDDGDGVASGAPAVVTFATSPAGYRHWRLDIDRSVATATKSSPTGSPAFLAFCQ